MKTRILNEFVQIYLMYTELTKKSKKTFQQQYFLTHQGLFSFFLVPEQTFYADYVEIP